VLLVFFKNKTLVSKKSENHTHAFFLFFGRVKEVSSLHP
jgi:hypothetical protein